MAIDVLKALDVCLARIARGESVEHCLADYPQLRAELEPLLKTAAILSSVPKISPSENFRRTSQVRLMEVLRAESPATSQAWDQAKPAASRSGFWPKLSFRPLVAATVAIVLLVAVSLSFVFFRSSPATAETTLSILNGNIEIQKPNSSVWDSGADGMNLIPGSRVKTELNSYAVLTYIDGSTSKLEPETELTIKTSEYKDPLSARVILEQSTGKAWHHIQSAATETTSFEVKTPVAEVIAQGTSFYTEIDAAGSTLVKSVEGTVKVNSQNKVVFLAMGQQTLIKPGTVPEPPQTLAESSELSVSTDTSAVCSVLDPNGSSTGYLPNGLSFNQITNSKNTLASDGQLIEIGQPASGEYAVVVRSLSQEPVPVNIQIKSAGKEAFTYSDSLKGDPGTSWLIRIQLNKEILAADKVVSVEPLGNRSPEKIVETKIALDRATPIAPPAKPSETPAASPVKPSPITTPSEPNNISIPNATTATTTPTPTPTPTPAFGVVPATSSTPTTPESTPTPTPASTPVATSIPVKTTPAAANSATTSNSNSSSGVSSTPNPTATTPSTSGAVTSTPTSPATTVTVKPTPTPTKATNTPKSSATINSGTSGTTSDTTTVK